MSIARHFDTLSRYGAGAARVVPLEGEPEDLLDAGGALELQYEVLGRAPLLEVLRDPSVSEVLLADGDLSVTAKRDGGRARLAVRWGAVVISDALVDLPTADRAPSGPLFRPDPDAAVTDLRAALWDAEVPLFATEDIGGTVRWFTAGLHGPGVGAEPLAGAVRAVDPAELGSRAFQRSHGVRWSYVAGAMAGGIASTDLQIALARVGLLSFFGAGGLGLDAVEAALTRVTGALPSDAPVGFNLLHNPTEPAVEERTVDLYLRYGVRRVEAAAFMGLTPALVRFRTAGIHRGADGQVVAPNAVFAKVSRPEVAEKFLRPAPAELLAGLVASGVLTDEQAALAAEVPVAADVTAEADSGGHTDHRPLVVLLPVLQRLRDRIAQEQGWTGDRRPRVGAAGGLGTPAAVWGAFAMGADYVLTGSVNQATREAGTSELAKRLLIDAQYFDVGSGPAPDMFELGAEVQVLSRGAMYAQRARRLHELYRSYGSLSEIPAVERQKIESQLFKRPLDEVWEECVRYWGQRDPEQLARAARDGRHQMALVFRWYLGMTSRWARMGDVDRKRDFQIWCGPAMGGFNQWVTGSWLAPLEARGVAEVADALMRGAAAHARVTLARSLGLPIPWDADAVPVPAR